MGLKTLHRNIIPATAIAAAGTLTSPIQKATVGYGIRFYVTVAGGTAGGGVDTLFLCGVPPALTQANPAALLATPVIPLIGFANANSLAVNGVYTADFYPGAWLPPTIAAGSASLGVAGISLPLFWAVRLVLGAGNSATITVDGEYL